ncbi:MAG TPA: outer membrane beta-barrel protein [Prevotella sp.]
MKKIVLAALLNLVSLGGWAQSRAGTFSLIPRLGVNIATMSGNSYFYNLGTGDAGIEVKPVGKAGFTGGVDLMYQFTDVIGGSVGVFYGLQGCRYKNHEEVMDEGKLVQGVRNNAVNAHYVNVPLMLHGYVAQGLSINVGVQVGFSLHAKWKFEWENYEVDKDGNRTFKEAGEFNANIGNNFKTIDVAIPMGVSYEYMNVVLDARYNLGITKVFKYDNVKNNNFVFTVGYKFDL